MSLFAPVKNVTLSFLPKLTRDPNLATVITWRVFQESEFDEDQGVNVDRYTDYQVPAIRIEKGVGATQSRNFPAGSYTMAVGDSDYIVDDRDKPAGVSIRDVIVDGEITYSIRRMIPVFNLLTRIETKGYA